MALTEIGEAYLLRAHGILAELDDADALVGNATRQPSGNLRICAPAFAVHQLTAELPHFHRRYPHISTGDERALMESLDAAHSGRPPDGGNRLPLPAAARAFFGLAAFG